jgi:hypothetical protein
MQLSLNSFVKVQLSLTIFDYYMIYFGETIQYFICLLFIHDFDCNGNIRHPENQQSTKND